MKTVSTAVFAALMMASTAGAEAADLAPSPGDPAPLPAIPPAISRWEGFYAGAHLGSIVGDWDGSVEFLAIDCSTCSRGETRSASFGGLDGSEGTAAGGIQAGYNWQSGALVFGLEVDGTLTGRGGSRSFGLGSSELISAGLGAITDPTDGFSARFRSEIDWMASARGRVGFATGRFLVYATGGLAVADVETSASYLSLIGTPNRIVPVTARDSSTELGWTIGAGLEAAIAPNLTARAEYLYTDFGRTERPLGLYINDPATLRQFVSAEEDVSLHTIRIGLNVRFP